MTTRKQWIREASEHLTPGGLARVSRAPTWLLELAARYGRLAKAGGLRTQTEFRMHAACVALNEYAVRGMSEVWKYMVVREHEEAKAQKRAAPREPKPQVQRSRRPTARATVLALLQEDPVRPDDQIIEAVHAATFHDGFNRAQLAWYKAAFRRGIIKGQAGPSAIKEVDNSMQNMPNAPERAENDPGRTGGHAGRSMPKTAIKARLGSKSEATA